ncbi:MAG: hypothetical protein IJJ33_16650 [Victivallales bacterium]|nr:hypothetical protein [Victivallales bacterium]
MRKTVFIWVLLLSLAGYCADEENLFPDPTFRSWSTTAERHFGANIGENGGPGLVVERHDPKVFDFKMEKITAPMKPDTRYEVTYRVMSKDVSRLKLGAAIRLEFQKNGEWAGAFMRRSHFGTSGWTTYRYEVTTPKEFDEAFVGFFLGMPFPQPENQTGYAVFCRPVIRELKPIWNVDLLYPVQRHALRSGHNRLIFTHAVIGVMENPPASITAEFTGATQLTREIPFTPDRFVIEVELAKGESTLTLKYGDFTKVIEMTAGAEMPPYAIWIDERGRVVRNGKPFLPVAIIDNQFTPTCDQIGYVITNEDFQLFLDSPFTTWSHRGLWWARFEGEPKIRWGEITRREVDNALKLMDRVHAAGKTVIIQTRPLHEKSKMLDAYGAMPVLDFLIDTYSGHPALLFWTRNDETDVSATEKAIRAHIAKRDPWHPTLQFQYKVEQYGECIGGADLFCMDNYPIYDENSTLEIVAKAMDAMHKTFSFDGHIACGCVPQIFNWNNYQKTCPYYFPKEEQIRASVILCALSGVKWYKFYSRQWLREGVDHDGYLERWRMVCRIAQMLRDLEPYLLSDQEHPTFELKAHKGEVRAQAFRANDGRLALLIANAGKGEGVAEITFPGSESLASQYGLTKLENGKWLFSGVNAAGDVIK